MMQKKLSLFLSGIVCLIAVSCNDNGSVGTTVAFDPTKPIVVDDFYPDSGGVSTSMIISGQNFGSDTTGLRVLYIDEDGIPHKGGLVSSNGEKIYCTVPKGLTFKRNITVQVVRDNGNDSIVGEAPNKFIYRTQTAVTTVVGQPNSESQPTVGGTLTTATLSCPGYICLDDEDNMFIVERIFDSGWSDQYPKKSDNSNSTGNVVLASLTRDNVQVLSMGLPDRPNAPVYSDEVSFQATYVPFDAGMDFVRYQKATNYAQQIQRVIKTEETKDIDTKNWKFCFVVNKIDKQLYTVMHKGQLVRINPKTRKATVLLNKIGIHDGSDSFFAFSPVQPNRMFIIQTKGGEIWYVDIDQLEGKDINEYHGEPYAGRACWEGVSAGWGWEDGLLKNAKFKYPGQCCFTADGKLYFADIQNHCIRCIDTTLPDNKATVTTVIGLPGSPGFKEGGPDVAQFRNPRGVAVNADGSIVYVADTGNRCIRKLTIE